MLEHKPKALVLGVGPENGLGGALCKRFADEGYHIFISGRSQKKIAAVASRIETRGGTATTITCDATQEKKVIALFDAVQHTGKGRFDLAVYNVGNNMPGHITQMEADYFERAWRIGCFGGFLFGRETARRMLPDGGTLLFTGASASRRGKAGFGAFNSAKSALRTFAEALAKEYGPKGLHVGHVIIDGGIAGDKILTRFPAMRDRQEQLISLEGLAEAYWYLHRQPKQAWTFELDVRTMIEPW